MTKIRDVLFKKDFFALWTGQIISEFGDRLFQMAMIALVYAKAPGSVMAMANLFFFIIVPVFVIGPFAGVYVDRWDRKLVMIISDIVRAGLVLLIPLLIKMDAMPIIYGVVFLIFSATRFFLPSKLAFIPDIVPEDKLMMANSLSNTTRMIATMLGLSIAGYIVKLIGPVWGFYLDAVSYFASALLIAVITPKEKLVDVKEDIEMTRKVISGSLRKRLWAEMAEGIDYMISSPRLKSVTGIFFMLMAGAGSIFCVIIVFIQDSFGTVTTDLGLFGVFIGAGLFVGTILHGKFGAAASRMKAIFGGFVFGGMGICGFAVYAAYGNAVPVIGGVLMFVIGAFSAPILTCANTLVHELVPDEIRGRIFSSMEAVIHFAFLVFMFVTAILAGHIPKFYILISSGAVFIFAGISGLFLEARKKVREG